MANTDGQLQRKLQNPWRRGIANRFVCLNDADAEHLIASEEWNRFETADLRFYEDFVLCGQARHWRRLSTKTIPAANKSGVTAHGISLVVSQRKVLRLRFGRSRLFSGSPTTTTEIDGEMIAALLQGVSRLNKLVFNHCQIFPPCDVSNESRASNTRIFNEIEFFDCDVSEDTFAVLCCNVEHSVDLINTSISSDAMKRVRESRPEIEIRMNGKLVTWPQTSSCQH